MAAGRTARFGSDYDATESIRSSLAGPSDATFTSGPQLLFPRSIGLGVTWLPRPLLRLAADVTYEPSTFCERNDACTDRADLPVCVYAEPMERRSPDRQNRVKRSRKSALQVS